MSEKSARVWKDQATGEWCVEVGTLPYEGWHSASFRGPDAQRLAYEYAAGVLGKKAEHPEWIRPWMTACKMPPDSNVYKPDPFLSAYVKARASTPPSPWISVKTMGPAKRPNGQNTFVLAAKVGPDGCEYIRLGETDGTYWHNVSSGTRLEGVTHWMPLPEPPKE